MLTTGLLKFLFFSVLPVTDLFLLSFVRSHLFASGCMNSNRGLNKKWEKLSCSPIPLVIASTVPFQAPSCPLNLQRPVGQGPCYQGAPSLVAETEKPASKNYSDWRIVVVDHVGSVRGLWSWSGEKKRLIVQMDESLAHD